MEVYNYLASYYKDTYGIRGSSRQDAHKRTELRKVCKQIANINKESPIYRIRLSSATQCYAIDVKELARELKGALQSITSNESGEPGLFDKKHLYSTNPDALSVRYVGEHMQEDADDVLEIQVNQLAKPQINTGTYLSSSASNLNAQTYSFQINMEKLAYEFEFYVSPSESNLSIQSRMANLINRADIGVEASILEDEAGHSAMELKSTATGSPRNGHYLFTIKGGEDENSRHLVDVLGIGTVSQAPQDARFLIDGQENSSHSNHFTVDKKYEIRLHENAPEDGTVTLGFHTDSASIAEDIKSFFSTYNHMISFAKENQVQPSGSRKLHQDLGSIAKHFANELEPLGLDVQEDGSISVDDKLLTAAITEGNPQDNFNSLESFTKALAIRTNHILLDPMHYVDKMLICYPNPMDHTRVAYSPYHPSNYSGLLYNGYV